MNIFQKSPFAKAYFINGELDTLNINFIGLEIDEDDQNQYTSINDYGLTGCLTFINMKFYNVDKKINYCFSDDNSKELIDIKTTFPEINVGKIGNNVKYYDAGSKTLAFNCYKNLFQNLLLLKIHLILVYLKYLLLSS